MGTPPATGRPPRGIGANHGRTARRPFKPGRRSKEECDFTVVSVFVNPKQFGPQEDFSKYPRNLDADLEKLAAQKVDLVFAPTAEEMYPPGFATQVEVTGLANVWEGAVRPTHFRGVATVVLKLFQIAPADRAYFGQKDYQQSVLVRRMAIDLNLPTEVVVCPHGARAGRFGDEFAECVPQRRRSPASRGAVEKFTNRSRDVCGRRARRRQNSRAVQQTIAAEPGLQIDYAAIVDPETLDEVSHITTSAVALVAARVGSTRLIDNEILGGKR